MTSSNLSNKRRRYLSRREFLRQSAIAGVALGSAGLLASCGQSAAPPPADEAGESQAATSTQAPAAEPTATPVPSGPKRGGEYVFGTNQEIQTLDPHKPGLLNNRNVWYGLFSGLVKMDPDMKVQPALAESWEVAEDGLTYTFNLRQGVKFHNGREMTAEDVKFTLDRVVDPETGSQWAAFSLPQYDRSEVVDDYTIKLVNKKPFAPQIDGLATVLIVAKENVDALAEQPIGTGPFKLDEYIQDDRVVMSRFEDYWNADQVYLDKVTVKTIKDPTASLQALKTGELHSIWQISTRNAQEVIDHPDLELYTSNQHAVVQMLMVDNNEWPFNDVRARQALSYATNREAINEVAFFGLFEPHWYNTPLPAGHWAFNPDTPKAEYDLQKAKELFEAAGVTPEKTEETPIVYQALTTVNPEWVVVGEILQESFAEIGLKLEIEKLDLAAWVDVFVPADQKNFPARIISNGNVAYSDPHHFFNRYEEGLQNYNHYTNSEVQALIAEAATVLDRDERFELYARAQELMAEDPPCSMPYVQHGLYGKSKALKGFYAESTWVPHYENAWFDS